LTPGDHDDLDALLDEQLAYYRARAPEYSKTALPELPIGDLPSARAAVITEIEALGQLGDVLELACGPGTWTAELSRGAASVTAVDGAPEMLRLAATKVNDERVRFEEANVFEWEPDQLYDLVFFGFWLSHVPLERFEEFWSLVARSLKPGGRVAFVDDAYRTPDELVEGAESSVIRRQLTDGSQYRAVKVPHTPDGLEQRLRRRGWDISVRSVGGPFFWGSGRRA
jgi:demethylmenaquinone methyltransferase/2-methoxy-6-polyprenyl-1,4-benzoquinol methylase